MSRSKENRQSKPFTLSPAVQAAVAFAGPLLAALLASSLLPGQEAAGSTAVPLLTALALVSWLLGLWWYGLRGLGLRGGRPIFAGIGFAVLAWVAFLLLRFIFVRLIGYGSGFRIFVYLLLFEAFAVQLWTFGLLFRAFADWRGPLTAAIASGLVFGAVAYAFFQEAVLASPTALLYFLTWGVLYGLIRLRTGSFLGIALVQALQSFTAWTVLVAPLPPTETQLQTLYLVASLAYGIIIWRLWPQEEDDYRV